MANDSPAAILFDSYGNEIALSDGYSITIDTKGIPLMGVSDGGVRFIQLFFDGETHRLQTSSVLTERAAEVVIAAFIKRQISVTTYFMVIDLDNQSGAGPYKHTWQSGEWLYVTGIDGLLVKQKPADQWDSKLGVVLRIDETSADIGWFPAGTLYANDTGSFVSTSVHASFNTPVSLEVNAGDLTKVALGYVETVTAVNTGITIKDIKGNNITPAVGDLISKITLTGGSGTAEIHYGISYFVE